MNNNQKIRVFLDEETIPFAEFSPPVKFVLDTTKIPDGKHKLKIVALSTSGKEGTKTVPFVVRNGPSIDVVGLQAGDIVTDQVTVTLNSYGSERNDFFLIRGSETPKGIPSWVWATLISFVGFALFYFIMYWDSDHYQSFF